jgi:hypothetical protein
MSPTETGGSAFRPPAGVLAFLPSSTWRKPHSLTRDGFAVGIKKGCGLAGNQNRPLPMPHILRFFRPYVLYSNQDAGLILFAGQDTGVKITDAN